jgi:hypothetical protein
MDFWNFCPDIDLSNIRANLPESQVKTTCHSMVKHMALAPEPILFAGLDTCHWAWVHVRNATLSPAVDRRHINEVAEALHEIPFFLMSWEQTSLDELRLHLRGFDARRWPGAPNFLLYFDQKLKEYESPSA